MPKPRRKKPTALGVHIFAGGFTCGVKQAGFNVLAHLEETNYGVSSAKLNWPDLEIRIGQENWRPEDFQGKVDFLYSNPPCAIFSTAGISTTQGPDAWRSDPRLDYWHHAFTTFETIGPKVFALESVCQAYTKGREEIDNFTKRSLALGYSIKHIMVDAKWTKIPQSRKRFFFIAHSPELLLNLSFSFESPLTVIEVLRRVKYPGYITRHDTGANFAQWIKHTLAGGKLRESFDRLAENKTIVKGRMKGRPGFMWCRLPRDGQMGSFTGDTFTHPVKNRFVGVEEMKALCGYPRSFKVDGNPRGHASLLARAVLPPVGKWLGKTVIEALKQKRKSDWPLQVLFVDLRKPDIPIVDFTYQYQRGKSCQNQ